MEQLDETSEILQALTTYDERFSGGVKLSGRAAFNFVRGGVKLNGQSDAQCDYNVVLRGSIKSSGRADFDFVRGGVKFSGESDIVVSYDATRQPDEWDVIAVAGKNIPRQSHDYYGNCYFKLNGSQLHYVINQSSPSTTNITLRGPANTYNTVSTYAYIPGPYANPIQGNITLDAAAINIIRSGNAYIQFSGGYFFRSQLLLPGIVGGSAIYNIETSIIADGGIGISGTSAQNSARSIVMNPSIQLSGSADVMTILTPRIAHAGLSPSGMSEAYRISYENMRIGVALQGESSTEFTYTPDLGGGILCDTTNIYSHYLAVALDGEIMLGGSANEERIYWPRSEGSINIDGTTSLNFIDQVEGRVGVRLGGKVGIFYEKYYQSFRSGYGRAMASENIYTSQPSTNLLITNDDSPTLTDYLPALVSAGWCDITEPRTNAIIPKVLQKRMGKYLPPKQQVKRQVTSLTQKSTTRYS